MLPEVPKIEMAKEKKKKGSQDRTSAYVQGAFGRRRHSSKSRIWARPEICRLPSPRSWAHLCFATCLCRCAAGERESEAPTSEDKRDTSQVHGLRTRRSRRSLGCVPAFLSLPFAFASQCPNHDSRDENEIAGERSEPSWRHPQPPPSARASSSPRPTPRPLSPASAARAGAPWGCHGAAGARAFGSFDERRRRTRAGLRAGVRRWRRPRRSQWLVATSSRSPPASWASSPASPSCFSTSRYGSHLASSTLV